MFLWYIPLFCGVFVVVFAVGGVDDDCVVCLVCRCFKVVFITTVRAVDSLVTQGGSAV